MSELLIRLVVGFCAGVPLGLCAVAAHDLVFPRASLDGERSLRAQERRSVVFGVVCVTATVVAVARPLVR